MAIPRKNRKTSNGFLPPPILLERPEPKDLEKDYCMTFKLKTNPRSSTSPEYSLNMPYFCYGSPEEWPKFLMNLKRLFEGQNVAAGSQKFATARRLLIGESLSLFEQKARTFILTDNERRELDEQETAENFELAMRAVTTKAFPLKALNTQKRYMKKVLRKPKEMRVCDFLARFKELNKYLEEFPLLKEEYRYYQMMRLF